MWSTGRHYLRRLLSRFMTPHPWRQLGRLYFRLRTPVRRTLVLVAGSAILIVGLAMLFLPGPGLLVIGLAVALFSVEFVWARRLIEHVSRWATALRRRAR